MVHCIRVAGFSFHFTEDEEGVNWVDGEPITRHMRQPGRISIAMTVTSTVFLLKESSGSLINTQLCKVSHYVAVMQIACKKKKRIVSSAYHLPRLSPRPICMAQPDALIEFLPAWGVH